MSREYIDLANERKCSMRLTQRTCQRQALVANNSLGEAYLGPPLSHVGIASRVRDFFARIRDRGDAQFLRADQCCLVSEERTRLACCRWLPRHGNPGEP